jgi:hypothetical protein
MTTPSISNSKSLSVRSQRFHVGEWGLGFTFAFAATVATVRQPVRAKFDNNFSALYSLLRKQARVNALNSRGGKRRSTGK